MTNAMTEERARAICRELGATFTLRKRRNALYCYVSRWVPRRVVEATGWKTQHSSNGQAFDRYVCALAQLGQVSEATLRQRIAVLPANPNTAPTPATWQATALAQETGGDHAASM